MSLVRAFVFAVIAICSTGHVAAAQYFGRNQVRYDTFDFRVLKTEHFDIYYYDEEAEAIPHVARMAERWYHRLSKALNHELSGRQPIIFYASQPHFIQTTALLGSVGEGTLGATEPFKRRVVMPMAGTFAETDHVLGHELVHAFQFDITSRSGLAFAPPSASGMPLWFIEGMAEFLSVGPVDPHTAMWMRDAARVDRLPNVAQLENPRFFPYRYGQALWAYIAGRWGDELPGQILRRAAETGVVLPIMQMMLGLTPDSLVRAWQAAMEETYRPFGDSTRAAADYGRAVLPSGKEARGREGRLNLAPALSPDGTRLVFLSERDRLSIDMFLADAVTGQVQRKIIETAMDPHFESLHYANSAGAWHPDGRRFAFAGVAKGRPVITVVDVDKGKVLREFQVEMAQEVSHPSWSPDGHRLVFGGLAGGLSDVFILDVCNGEVRRLTHDAFADIQPAWSPDGRSIAIATDRFTTDLRQLEYGDLRLALVDPETGEFTELPHFPRGKHINPQWGQEDNLFFLSDRTGITNVYRLELGNGALHQVTNLYTGVSGIAGLSPALSVAANAPRLVYSAYENQKHDLFAIDSLDVLAGEQLHQTFAQNPAVLPPVDRSRVAPIVDLTAILADAASGLPDSAETFQTVSYRPKLALDFVNPASIGVGGGGAFGPVVGGGSAVIFGDMLRQHALATGLQVFGGFEDIAAAATYRNVRSRMSWGFAAGQAPYLSIAFRRRGNPSNDAVIVDSLFRFRQTDRQLTGVVAYPFNRIRRIEFNAGYRHSNFDREVVTRVIRTEPPNIGVQVGDPVDLRAPSGIGQWEASLALVYDNTLYGPTSPVRGQRYRFEVGPSVGTLSYLNVLFDFRRYQVIKRPYTLAARIFHYGRYGVDSDDERLLPIFIGYQTLVRGYASSSFDLRGCAAIIRGPNDCPVPVFQDMIGSKILVSNVELRFPALQLLGLASAPSPRLPLLDLALFADAGVAWTRTDQPQFSNGGRRGVISSYGVALRANLFGAAIIEVDFVHPNDRPGDRWLWQFGFSPGW